MKKILSLLILALLTIVSLIACGNSLANHELVGTWEDVNFNQNQFVFNADGTGDEVEDFVSITRFYWTVSNGIVRQYLESDKSEETLFDWWEYDIEDDILTMTMQSGREWVHRRVE